MPAPTTRHPITARCSRESVVMFLPEARRQHQQEWDRTCREKGRLGRTSMAMGPQPEPVKSTEVNKITVRIYVHKGKAGFGASNGVGEHARERQ